MTAFQSASRAVESIACAHPRDFTLSLTLSRAPLVNFPDNPVLHQVDRHWHSVGLLDDFDLQVAQACVLSVTALGCGPEPEETFRETHGAVSSLEGAESCEEAPASEIVCLASPCTWTDYDGTAYDIITAVSDLGATGVHWSAEVSVGGTAVSGFEFTALRTAPYTLQIDGTAWKTSIFQQNHAGWCSWYVARQILSLRGEG